MTILKRSVTRETHGTVFEKGKHRPVIITLKAPNLIEFRAKGCKGRYYLTAEVGWNVALRGAMVAAQKEKRRLKKLKKQGLL